MRTITSKDNELIKYAYKLKDSHFAKSENKFLVEGMHLVKEASDYIETIFTLKKLEFIDEEVQIIVTEAILEKISSAKSTPKVIAICKAKKEKPIKETKVVYLNNVQDPGNVGTIIRTALAFKYFDIILDEGTASKYNQKVIQASQGSIFQENIVNGTYEDLLKLKEQGYKVLVTALTDEAVSLNSFNAVKNEKLVIVFGNEGQGVEKRIIDIANYVIKIPISNIDSLNVSVAAGILLYNIYR